MRQEQQFSVPSCSIIVIFRLKHILQLRAPLLMSTFLLLMLSACDKRSTPQPAALSKKESSTSSLTDAPEPLTSKNNALSHYGSPPSLGASANKPACLAPFSTSPALQVANASSCPTDPNGRPNMPSAVIAFESLDGPRSIQVEIARTQAHQRHGLMYRSKLEDGTGMLFTFPDTALRSFWMKNTCLALDMIFLDSSGFIVGILEQVPPQNLEPRAISCMAKYVLEVPAGYARKVELQPGSHMALPQLNAVPNP